MVEDVDLKNPSRVKGRIPHGRITYFEGNYAELKGKVVTTAIDDIAIYIIISI